MAISTRKRPGNSDRDDQLKLKLALRAARIGIWDWDLRTNEMNYDVGACGICGFHPSKPVTYEMVRDVTHPDDYPRTSAMAQRALDPKIRASERYRYRLIRADNGEVRWAEANGEAIFSGSGESARAIRYVGTIEDITDRIQEQEGLAGLATRLQLAIEASGLAVWEYDVSTGAVKTSPELNRLYGFQPDASPTIDEFRARYIPGEQERVQAAAQAALQKGEVRFECEFQVRHLAGLTRWLLLRAEIKQNEDGQYTSVIGVVLDVDERKRAEESQRLMARELNHRVKNSLSVVQALVRQTFRAGVSVEEAVQSLELRIGALAAANDILVSGGWTGFGLRALVEHITSPYRGFADPFQVDGADCHIEPSFNVPVALVLHEMCTNAAKYGALSVPDGRVDISWRVDDRRLHFNWIERGGPPVVEPSAKGFGTILIGRLLAKDFEHLSLDFASEGVQLRFILPEGSVLAVDRTEDDSTVRT